MKTAGEHPIIVRSPLAATDLPASYRSGILPDRLPPAHAVIAQHLVDVRQIVSSARQHSSSTRSQLS
jgi:hypothetical protein